MQDSEPPAGGFRHLFPDIAPERNRRTIAWGYAVFLVGYFVLFLGLGYSRFPCYASGPCLDIPNPLDPIALYFLALVTVPLPSIFVFRPAIRIGGAVTVLGAIVLILGTLFLWTRWFPFGETSIQILTTSPPWVPILKLGGVLIGSVLMVLGCVANTRHRVPSAAGPSRTAAASPIQAP